MRIRVEEEGERKGEIQLTDDSNYSMVNVIMRVKENTAQLFNQISLKAILDAYQ